MGVGWWRPHRPGHELQTGSGYTCTEGGGEERGWDIMQYGQGVSHINNILFDNYNGLV